jgi:predicted MFS family arabinose efflux permease
MSALSTSALSTRSALRRFLVLTALRWTPPGLLFPVFVMLPLSRGLSLSELGVAFAMQGLVVFALELPTGGLADSIGRRPVLLVSILVSIISIGLFLVADSFALFAVVFALQGVYRALDSGPLEAWYVEAVRAADPDAPIDRGLSAHGTVLGVAIAVGSLASGGLIALDPIPGVDALVVPVILALAVQVASLVAVAVLMTETPPAAGLRGVARSALATPRTIADGVGLLRRNRVLLALVAVELFWGFGMVCFESLMPVRLSEVVGGNEAAAAITGPVVAVAWIASAVGSAATPLLNRWLGVAGTAALTRVLQGLAVAGMGFFAGVVGIVAAYIACNTVHGTSNAAHMTLLHRQAEDRVRATVVSLNSWISQPAAAIGVIALTAFAQATSVSMAMYVGAIVLAVAAPLYLPAWRQSRVDARPAASAPVPAPRIGQPERSTVVES